MNSWAARRTGCFGLDSSSSPPASLSSSRTASSSNIPDTISGRVSITGTQPVVEVVSRQSGHLESLRVRAGQTVAKGAILAIVENPARSENVLALDKRLGELASVVSSDASILSLRFRPEDSLGRLQQTYAEFLQTFCQLGNRLADDYAEKATVLLRQQIDGKRAQIASLRAQSKMMARELELAREQFANSSRAARSSMDAV